MNKAYEFNPLTAALAKKWQRADKGLAVSSPVATAAAIATAPVATTTGATTALSAACVVAIGAATSDISAAAAPLSLTRGLTLPGEGVGADVTERRLHRVGLRAARPFVVSVAAIIAAFLSLASAVATKLTKRPGARAGACIPATFAPVLACPATVAALWCIVAVQRRLQVQRVVTIHIVLSLRVALFSFSWQSLPALVGIRATAAAARAVISPWTTARPSVAGPARTRVGTAPVATTRIGSRLRTADRTGQRQNVPVIKFDKSPALETAR